MAIVLYLAIALIIPIGIGPDVSIHKLVAPSIIWCGALLASLLTIDMLFIRDYEDGTLERLILAPIPMEEILITKILTHWCLVCLPLCGIAPLAGILMNLDLSAGLITAATLLIGTPAISAIGAFTASITLGMKRGHLLQTVIIIPAIIPSLIFGSIAAGELIDGKFPEQALAALAAISLATFGVSPIASSFLMNSNLKR